MNPVLRTPPMQWAPLVWNSLLQRNVYSFALEDVPYKNPNPSWARSNDEPRIFV